MHIPQGPTSQLELVGFAQALVQAQRPNPAYEITNWIYIPNHYEEYRYILGTRGENPLICLGVNPSTATPNQLDNTLKSAQRVAGHNGFDSFLMLNVYAQRATDPNHMEGAGNPRLHRENLAAFAYALGLGRRKAPAVWAAWGALIEKRGYLAGYLRDLVEVGRAHNARWYSAGPRSRKGHPHHPLYLRRDSVLEDFPVEEYLEGLGQPAPALQVR